MEVIQIAELSNPEYFRIKSAIIQKWGSLYRLDVDAGRSSIDCWRETERGAKIAFTKGFDKGAKWKVPDLKT